MYNEKQNTFKKNEKENSSSKILSLLKSMNSSGVKSSNSSDLIPYPLEFKYSHTLNTQKDSQTKKQEKQTKEPKKNKFAVLYQGIQKIGGGLNNLGNTCFLNSVLQSVIFTLPMYNYFLYSKHIETCKIKNNVCLLCEFCKLTRELQVKKSTTPYGIARNLKFICKHLRVGRQEDAHEFLVYLLDALEKNYTQYSKYLSHRFIETKPTANKNNNLIQNVFRGEMNSEVTCLKCRKGSITVDKFVTVSLDILNSSSLENCLDNFCKSEPLFGSNKFYCENCKEKNDSKKRFLFKSLPNVLVLHLKRFDNFGRKIQRNIKYNIDLDMAKYCAGRAEGTTKYKLYSILIHNGYSSDSGHYYSFLKKQKFWYEMNDSFVERVNDVYAMGQLPYMFFYIKQGLDRVEPAEDKKPKENFVSLIKENNLSLASEKNSSFMKEKNHSQIIEKNHSLSNERNPSLVKDKDSSPVIERKTFLIKEENISLNREKSRSVVKETHEREESEKKKSLNTAKAEEKVQNNSVGENEAFLEMKANFEKNFKGSDSPKKREESSKVKRDSIMSGIYHSRKVSGWDDSSEEEEKNSTLIASQKEFISRAKDSFLQKKVKRKSEYDINLDKGKQKKIKKKKHKKHHKNYFQQVSDIQKYIKNK